MPLLMLVAYSDLLCSCCWLLPFTMKAHMSSILHRHFTCLRKDLQTHSEATICSITLFKEFTLSLEFLESNSNGKVLNFSTKPEKRC